MIRCLQVLILDEMTPLKSMMQVFFSSSEGEWIHQPRKEEDK